MTCEHLIIKYLGQQHTSRDKSLDKLVDIYNCLECDCHSTITIDPNDYIPLFKDYYVNKCMSGSMIPLIKYVIKKNNEEKKRNLEEHLEHNPLEHQGV